MKSLATLMLAAALMISGAATGQSFNNSTSLMENTHNSGGCVGVVDMNQDGMDDIVILDESIFLSVCYQQADGSFDEVEFDFVSGNNQWGMAVADIDNDGHNDVFCGGAYDGVHVMYLHEDGTFTLEDLEEGSMFMQGANLADMNNDGWLDAFGCHDDAESRIWGGDGMGALVPQNDWIDMVTTPSSDNSGNYGSVWSDFDRDGDIDLYIAKCRQGVNDPMDPRRINALFENDGSNNYSNTGLGRGLVTYEQSWTTDFADIDNDGDWDCLLTNHSNTMQILENQGAGYFEDITSGSNLDIGGFFLQAKFADFDNDGWVDLIYTGGLHALYRNNGDNTFTEVPDAFPMDDTMHSFGLGDLNHDGWMDVYASYGNGYVSPDYQHDDLVWMNEGGENNWIAFNLETMMPSVGVNAVGATIQIDGPFGVQIREVRSGESYGINNTFAAMFGLGSFDEVETVTVFWPDGGTTVITNPSVNDYNTVEQFDCSLDGIEVTIDGSLEICPGETVDLMAPMGYNYVWTNGESTQMITVGEQGNYTVVAYDDEGCSAASTTITVMEVTPTAPTIEVIGDTEFCEGGNVILSSSDAVTYDWSNGLDTQDIVITEGGDYSVEITDICDSPIASETITVAVFEAPDTPVIDDITLDVPGEGTFIGGSENLTWYDAEDATEPLFQGAEFTTNLDETTSYWVEDVIYHGGGEGQGGLEEWTDNGQYHFNSGFYLMFDAHQDMIIDEVTIFTENEGDRTIGVQDSFGNVIAQGTFTVPAGEQVVQLGFAVPEGTDYALRSLDDDPEMWRDESEEDLAFPFELGEVATITTTNVNSDNWNNYWYFFYDWKVSGDELACTSERVEVIGNVLSIDNLEGTTSLEVFPNPTDGDLSIAIESLTNGKLNVTLRDATGRSVMAEQWQVVQGAQRFDLNVTGMAPGMYSVTFDLNGNGATRQLVVR